MGQHVLQPRRALPRLARPHRASSSSTSSAAPTTRWSTQDGKPAGWRGYLGIGNISYGSTPGESTLEVIETLDELRPRIPPQLYDMVARVAAASRTVEDLDI